MSDLRDRKKLKFETQLSHLKNPHIIKRGADMRTALYILSKVLSTIWAIVSVPLELVAMIIIALIVYIATYLVIITGILWILIG